MRWAKTRSQHRLGWPSRKPALEGFPQEARPGPTAPSNVAGSADPSQSQAPGHHVGGYLCQRPSLGVGVGPQAQQGLRDPHSELGAHHPARLVHLRAMAREHLQVRAERPGLHGQDGVDRDLRHRQDVQVLVLVGEDQSLVLWELALLLSECQRRPCLVSDVEANDSCGQTRPRRSR
jgi:hypothetical protein